MKRPALWLAGILAVAALAAVIRVGLIAIPIVIIGAVVFCVRKKCSAVPIVIGLLFFCFTVVHAFLILNHTTQLDEFHNTDVTITAQAVGYPEYTQGRSRALFRILEAEEISDYAQNDKILLSVYDAAPVTIEPGSIYRVTGRLKVPESETNPGGFDYNFYLKTQKIHLTMWTREDTFELIRGDHLPLHFEKLLQLRTDCIAVIDRFLPQEEGNVLSSMLFGTDEMASETLERFRSVGVAHVLAVSGLHTGILYLFVSWALKLFRVKKKPRATVIAIVLAVYVLLAGMSVSVTRASLMLLCFALADGFGKGKTTDGFNSICIAAVLILLLNPLALFSVSFQLSFIAVSAIVLFVPIAEKKIKIRQPVFKKIITYILLTFIVQIAVAPILAYYFNSFSAISLFANLLIVPVVSVALIGGFLGMLVSFIPSVATVFFTASDLVLKYIIQMSAWLAQFPFASFYVGKTKWYGFVCVYMILFAVFGYINLRAKIQRRVVLSVLGVSIILYICTFFPPLQTKLYFIDVGFGDSTLIETNRGETVLIDGGGYLSNDTATYDILPLLDQCDIRTLDCVVVTHSDSDHIKGIIGIIGTIKIDVIYANDDGGALYDDLVKKAQAHDVPVVSVQKNDIIQVDSFAMQVLNSDFSAEKNGLRNDGSIVLKAEINEYEVLLLGDIGKKGIEAVTSSYDLRDVDLVKAPHHGGYYSNLKMLYEETTPDCVLIGVGANGYRLPSEKTLNLLDSLNLTYFRTDKFGCITVTFGNSRMKIDTYLSDR